MEYTNKELYKISKTVYREATLHQQIQAAGSNKAKFLERIDKKKSNFESQSIVMKILVAVYIVIFTAIPVTSFIQMNIVSEMPVIEDTWNLFVGGLSVSSFMLLQPIILILFTVTFTWGFLSKEPYTYVSTLPFSRNEISKISFFTFLRGINIQLIVLAFILPIGTMIGINFPRGLGLNIGNNFLMLFVCIIINLTNTMFNISLVVLLGRKMAKVMENEEENDRLSNLMRIGTIFIYLIFTMLASYGIQTALRYIPRLFTLENPFNADIINKVLSFIPFPFSGGYLLSSITIGITEVPILVVIGSVIGSFLQIGLAVFLFRKALRTLQDIISLEPKTRISKSKKPIIIGVRTSKPTIAFLKRDLIVITHELQTITYMILPIMIPISTALAYAFDMMIGTTGIHAMVPYITALAIFSTFFILVGITSVESGGETITSSLPINIRDQIKAKLPFLFSTVPVMVMLAILLQYKKDSFIDILIMTSVQLPAIFVIAIFGLFLKILFFGKFKYKYVIDEVNTKLKTIKLIGILLIMFALGVGFISSLIVGYWLTLIIEGICFIFLLVIYNLMFPMKKTEKLIQK